MYIYLSLISFFLAIALFCVLLLLNRITLYRYRNIAVAGGVFACIMFGIIFLIKRPETLLSAVLTAPPIFAQLSVTLFAVLFVLMLISNVQLMRREGMSVKNMAGSALQLIFVFATIVTYLFCRLTKLTVVPLIIYSLIDYFECVIVGVMVMGAFAVYEVPKYDRDYVIIPGCSIRKNGGLLPLLRGRVNRAIRFAWEQERATQKPVYYVPSGGQGADEIMSEGSAMELYLLAHSAESHEIFPEKQSKNTYENFKLSNELIKTLNDNAKVAFATTNYHALRCGMLAYDLGMDAMSIASKTKWYFWPNGFAREVVAIIVMSKRLHILMVTAITVLCILLRLGL